MKKTNTIIIGAGQAGLALSRCLFDRGVEHVILERGQVAQRWNERWDSLRLLSPNWMTRLPGWHYKGDRPDAFMSRDEVIRFLFGYAASFDAPVEEQTSVRRVSARNGGWLVETDHGDWHAESVAIATGHSQETRIPGCAAGLPRHIVQVASSAYRNPGQLSEGGVLVVGASASGIQLADEIHRSGREVTIAVGRHTRVPRHYRGHDIMYWLDRTGALQRPLSDMPDARDAKREPSLQLVADDFGRSLDLSSLSEHGARVVGRLAGIDGARVRFERDLAKVTAAADYQMARLLQRIDQYVDAHGLAARVGPADGWAMTPQFDTPEEIDLDRAGIRSVVWATGYRRDYSWLDADVLDSRGELRNNRGLTPAPGLFVLGLQFMIRRNSSFIDGVGRDAEEVATAVARRADQRAKEAA